MAAMEINVVISNICSYLSVPELKTVRLLNSVWRREAASYFRRKSRINLNLSPDVGGVATLKIYMAEMQHFGTINHVGIDISKSSGFDLGYFIGFLEGVAMTNFLQPGISSLILKIEGWDFERKMSSLLVDILVHLAPNLESLELLFFYDDEGPGPQLRIDGSLTFPKLKTFKEYINPLSSDSVMLAGRQPLVTYGNVFFPQLSSLEISGEVEDRELTVIANSNWTLKSLYLGMGDDYEKTGLTQVLKKVSHSLEHLTLTTISGQIIIPSFPNLKSLSIFFELMMESPEDGEPELENPGFVFETIQTEMEYFPDLKDLTLRMVDYSTGELADFENYQEKRDQLCGVFPEETIKVFKGLRSLTLSTAWKVWDEEVRARFSPQTQINYDSNED